MSETRKVKRKIETVTKKKRRKPTVACPCCFQGMPSLGDGSYDFFGPKCKLCNGRGRLLLTKYRRLLKRAESK